MAFGGEHDGDDCGSGGECAWRVSDDYDAEFEWRGVVGAVLFCLAVGSSVSFVVGYEWQT